MCLGGHGIDRNEQATRLLMGEGVLSRIRVPGIGHTVTLKSAEVFVGWRAKYLHLGEII